MPCLTTSTDLAVRICHDDQKEESKAWYGTWRRNKFEIRYFIYLNLSANLHIFAQLLLDSSLMKYILRKFQKISIYFFVVSCISSLRESSSTALISNWRGAKLSISILLLCAGKTNTLQDS